MQWHHDVAGLPTESESRLELESVGVDPFGLLAGVGVGVGKTLSTPTQARSCRVPPSTDSDLGRVVIIVSKTLDDRTKRRVAAWK